MSIMRATIFLLGLANRTGFGSRLRVDQGVQGRVRAKYGALQRWSDSMCSPRTLILKRSRTCKHIGVRDIAHTFTIFLKAQVCISRISCSAAFEPVGHCTGKGSRPTTAILVHGYDTSRSDWVHAVWGDAEKQQLGRLLHAVRLGFEEQADVLWLGGVLESEKAETFMWERIGELQQFSAFHSVDSVALCKWLQRALIRGCGTNTMEEVCAALEYFRSLDPPPQRVIVVSSPAHVPRCLRDASLFLANLRLVNTEAAEWRPTLLASECDTGFGRARGEDLRPVIIEPEHYFYSLAMRCLSLKTPKSQVVIRKLAALLDELEEEELS